jgi:hypothetical protein
MQSAEGHKATLARAFGKARYGEAIAFYGNGGAALEIGDTYFPPMNAMLPVRAGVPHSRPGPLAGADLPAAFSWASPADVTARAKAGNHNGRSVPATQILAPLNQSSCGSCWAVSSTSVLADRWAIAKSVPSRALASEVACTCAQKVPGAQTGACCKGGYIVDAANFFARYGVPEDACFPYAGFCPPKPTSACVAPACSTPMTNAAGCTSGGGAGAGSGYAAADSAAPRYKVVPGSIALLTPPGIDPHAAAARIMHAIYDKGPVATAFFIYDTFMHGDWSKNDGVYVRPAGDASKPEGGHAIVIVGWGTGRVAGRADPVPCWIVRNSWGTAWGTGGYFKVAMTHTGLVPGVGFDVTVPVGTEHYGGAYEWDADVSSGPARPRAPGAPGGGPKNPWRTFALIAAGAAVVVGVGAGAVALARMREREQMGGLRRRGGGGRFT